MWFDRVFSWFVLKLCVVGVCGIQVVPWFSQCLRSGGYGVIIEVYIVNYYHRHDIALYARTNRTDF